MVADTTQTLATLTPTTCADCGAPAPVQDDGTVEGAEHLGRHGWTLCGTEGTQTVVLCPDCWNGYWAGGMP